MISQSITPSFNLPDSQEGGIAPLPFPFRHSGSWTRLSATGNLWSHSFPPGHQGWRQNLLIGPLTFKLEDFFFLNVKSGSHEIWTRNLHKHSHLFKHMSQGFFHSPTSFHDYMWSKILTYAWNTVINLCKNIHFENVKELTSWQLQFYTEQIFV